MPELYGEVCIEEAAGAFFVTNRNRFNLSLSLSRVPKVSAKKGAFPDECVMSAVQRAKSEAEMRKNTRLARSPSTKVDGIQISG